MLLSAAGLSAWLLSGLSEPPQPESIIAARHIAAMADIAFFLFIIFSGPQDSTTLIPVFVQSPMLMVLTLPGISTPSSVTQYG